MANVTVMYEADFFICIFPPSFSAYLFCLSHRDLTNCSFKSLFFFQSIYLQICYLTLYLPTRGKSVFDGHFSIVICLPIFFMQRSVQLSTPLVGGGFLFWLSGLGFFLKHTWFVLGDMLTNCCTVPKSLVLFLSTPFQNWFFFYIIYLHSCV